MKRGKLTNIDCVTVPTGEKVEEVDKDKGYKYLGILEAGGIKSSGVKLASKKNI